MPEPIILVDEFTVRDGKLEELKQATKDIVELVAANEPRLLVYNTYFSDDGTRMTGIQVHPDSDSIQTHLAVAGPHFGPIMACLERGGTIRVFGSPSEQIRAQMTQMGSSMGITVAFGDLFAGFARLEGVR